MKKISIILTLAAAAISFVACKNDQIEPETAPEASISIVKSQLVIPAKGGEAYIVVKSENGFKAAAEKDWCSATIEKDTVKITAPANESLDSRYSKITVSCGEESKYVMIQQFGFKTTTFSPSDITCTADSAQYDLPYVYDELLEATVDQDWVELTITEDKLGIKIAENKTEGTVDNRSRKAAISWKLGLEEGTISIEQFNVDFMKPDANWTVSYDGYKVYETDGKKYEFIKNIVADPTISGMYYITYFSKEDYTASKLKMGDFITTLVPALKAEADEILKDDKELSYEDILYEKSSVALYSKFEPGDYYACAVGFDKDFAPTGRYAVSEFTKENSGGATGYAAWLGEWTIKRGSKTDTWVISQKVKGESYTITGIEGYSQYVVQASYDEASEKLVINGQTGCGTYTSSTYGECEICLYGGWDESSFATGGYVILDGELDGDTAVLTPHTVEFSDGSSADIERVQFIAVTSDSKYLSLTKDRTLLPNTLTKVGGDDPGTGSEQYSKWLGTWTAPNDEGETFDFTVSTREADKSFNLRGWEMDEDFFEDWEAPFGADKGTLALHVNTDIPIATNVNVGKSDPYDFFYYGTITYQGEEYVISGDYDAALGTIGSGGKATFTGQSISLEGISGNFDVKNFIVCGVNENNENDIISWKGESTGFPLTVTKASGSKSVKTFGNNRWDFRYENAVRIDPSHVLRIKEPELVEMKACKACSLPMHVVK